MCVCVCLWERERERESTLEFTKGNDSNMGMSRCSSPSYASGNTNKKVCVLKMEMDQLCLHTGMCNRKAMGNTLGMSRTYKLRTRGTKYHSNSLPNIIWSTTQHDKSLMAYFKLDTAIQFLFFSSKTRLMCKSTGKYKWKLKQSVKYYSNN